MDAHLPICMPLINVRTNISEVQVGSALLQKLFSALTVATEKSESYVMILLESVVSLIFAGN